MIYFVKVWDFYDSKISFLARFLMGKITGRTRWHVNYLEYHRTKKVAVRGQKAQYLIRCLKAYQIYGAFWPLTTMFSVRWDFNHIGLPVILSIISLSN